MWILAGILGVFLALDLFLFYFFWELMLVPMYFLIGIWGHEKRIYAALKFFLLHPGERAADAAGDPRAGLRP
jgi:NADH-quinone oxidoreductase subunit M